MKRVKKLSNYLLICLAALLICSQAFNVAGIISRAWLKTCFEQLPKALLVLVPSAFGLVCSQGKVKHSAALKLWLLGTVSLIVYYLIFFIASPQDFTAWLIFGAITPILASSSVLFAGLLFALILQPQIYDWLQKHSWQQIVPVLTAASVLIFILSAGNSWRDYSLFGLLLLVPFIWGMAIGRAKIKHAGLLGFLLLLGSLLVMILGTALLTRVARMQAVPNVMVGGSHQSWNIYCLFDPTSPVMLVGALGFLLICKSWFQSLHLKQASLLIPAIVCSTATITAVWERRFFLLPLNRQLTKSQMLLLELCLTIFALGTAWLIERFLLPVKKLQPVFQYLDDHDWLTVTAAAWQGIKNWAHRHRILLWTSLYLLLLSWLSIIIISDRFKIQNTIVSSSNVFVYVLAHKFFVPILTALLLWAAFAVVYAITTRYWVSMWLVTVLTLGFSIADKIKMNLRAEPIYPTELRELVNWQSLLSFVNGKLILIVSLVLLLSVAALIWLELKKPVAWHQLSGRLAGGLIGLLLLLTPLQFNQKGMPVYYFSQGFNNQPYFMNQKVLTQAHGPVLAFLDNIKVPIMTQPAGYDAAKIKQIAHHYQQVAKKINLYRHQDLSKQTLIFNLSESFVDPRSFPTVKFAKTAADPMPFIRHLSQRNTAGKMLSAGYGGGTANMEYESLTGFNMGNFEPGIMPYTQVTDRFQHYPTIRLSFPYASGIHPYEGTYYSRISNYKRFGFDKFAYLGSKYKIYDQRKIDRNPYLSDFTCYDNGLRQIKQRQGGQFINLISIQNHMPYNGWYNHNEFKNKARSRFLQQKSYYDSFIDYCKGVEWTDRAVKRFIGQIDRINKPITIVFYGDHYPSMISMENASQYPIRFHETTYFIYSNRYARQHGAVAKLPKDKIVNTSDFIAMALQQTNSKVSPYQALLTKVHQELPAITINYNNQAGAELVNQEGRPVPASSLTKKQRRLLHDYLLVQYDMTAGQGYSQKLPAFYR